MEEFITTKNNVIYIENNTRLEESSIKLICILFPIFITLLL